MSTHVSAVLERAAAAARSPRGVIDPLEGPTHADPALAQIGSSPQAVATVGMVALALLGGGLLLRNRLATDRALSSTSEPPREEFRSDREKVCDLVQENGGRMKQSEIVDRVDWSKAKVSRLLADLEEDDQVTKLRIGRENLVCLPGYEPPASRSADSTNTD